MCDVDNKWGRKKEAEEEKDIDKRMIKEEGIIVKKG